VRKLSTVENPSGLGTETSTLPEEVVAVVVPNLQQDSVPTVQEMPGTTASPVLQAGLHEPLAVLQSASAANTVVARKMLPKNTALPMIKFFNIFFSYLSFS
jgi:hypothetical protein